MKRAILILLIAASSAFAAPTKKPVTKPVEPPAISQTVVSAYDEAKRAQLITWIEQLRVKGNEAVASATLAQENLVKSEAQIAEAKNNILLLDTQIQNLTQWGINEQNGRINAEQQLSDVLKKYHFIKLRVALVLSILAGAFVGLVIWRFAPQVLNTIMGIAIGLGIPIATAIAIFTYIQIRL